MNKNITIIIPVHEYNDYIRNAIKSIEEQKNNQYDVLIVSANKKPLIKKIKSITSFKLIVKDGNTDYVSMVNEGVLNTKTDYFTILEYDDILYPNFIDNFYKYQKEFEFDMALHICKEMVLIEEKGEVLNAIKNEFVWAMGRTTNVGYWDFENVEKSNNYYSANAIYKKSAYVESGGLKSNIKLWFNYEFGLRFLNLGYKIFVIPKMMSEHHINREGSYLDNCSKNMQADEQKFYLNTAKKEYMFTEDREINYN